MSDINKAIGNKSKSKDSKLPKGTNYLLTIGIDDYEHCPKLNNAVKDTRDVANVLFEKYDFTDEYHFKLENKEATKNSIIALFREIKNTLTPSDNLLIYYSGHGEHDKDFDESHWVTVESMQGETGDYLSVDSLVKMIRAVNTHHTLLIIDSCFAGGWLVNRKSTQSLEKDPSRYVIASGRQEYASDGEVGKNSPFATALIEKLKSNEESLSAIGLGEYIKIQTIKATRETQRPVHNPIQIPEDKGGEFFFHPKAMGEKGFWQSILKSNFVKKFNEYINEYPEGENIEEAHWKVATLENTIVAYDNYSVKFPNGKYVKEALQRMEEIEEEEFWIQTETFNSLVAYRKYQQRYPTGKYVSLAETVIQTIKSEKQEDEIKVELETPKHTIIHPTTHIIQDPNLFTDPRDGQTYKTVKLKDGNIWMAENFNFDTGKNCYFYNGEEEVGKRYGRLYTWEAAMKARPNGWRLPTDEEWKKMIKNYEGDYIGSKVEGESAYSSLIEGGNSQFEILFGGCRNKEKEFTSLYEFGFYWSATGNSKAGAYFHTFSNHGTIERGRQFKPYAFSCRFIKIIQADSFNGWTKQQQQEKLVEPIPHIIKDINLFTDPRDGQEYKTVKLKDGKIWMAQNLNFDTGEECWKYNNDIDNIEKFGRLYSWNSVLKACPEGWHIPENTEWKRMINSYKVYVKEPEEEEIVIHKDLFLKGESGFAALLGGYINYEGLIDQQYSFGYYWSSVAYNINEAWGFMFHKRKKFIEEYGSDKKWGYSCRCIKN